MITSGIGFITRAPYLTMDYKEWEWLCDENPERAGRPQRRVGCMKKERNHGSLRRSYPPAARQSGNQPPGYKSFLKVDRRWADARLGRVYPRVGCATIDPSKRFETTLWLNPRPGRPT